MRTTGQIAKLLSVHPDTVRNYERAGLIPPARRSPLNGYRVWSEEDYQAIHRLVLGETAAK